MSRQILTLHIGYHKTGSTSLQSFLDQERAALLSHGLFYPPTEGDGSRDYHHKHLAFFMALIAAEREGAALAPHVEAMGDQIEASGAPRAIVSEESFSGASPRMIDALALFRRRFDVEVVAVLRRQDHYLQSYYQQSIRDYRLKKDFVGFLKARSWERLHYDTALAAWADRFGAGALRVVSHDLANRAGGVMAAVLTPLLGAALPGLLPRERRWHESKPAVFYDMLRLLSRWGLTEAELVELWERLRHLPPAARARLEASHPDLFARGFLTSEIAGTIASEFAASNRQTAAVHFGGADPFPGLPQLDDGRRIADLPEHPGFSQRDALAALALALPDLIPRQA